MKQVNCNENRKYVDVQEAKEMFPKLHPARRRFHVFSHGDADEEIWHALNQVQHPEHDPCHEKIDLINPVGRKLSHS
jgi:hypothetical protein